MHIFLSFEMRRLRALSICSQWGALHHRKRLFCTAVEAKPDHSPKSFTLSQKFHLDEAWASRIDQLAKNRLEGGYEWIATVQKKFAGVGVVNAVDVDIATQLAQETDQRKDIVDLVYRLRHTPNACDLLPSTEYAVFHLLLQYDDWENIFRIINDPINYGIFMNEHVSCIAIDRLLRTGNLPGAAKISSCVMQQEMFDFTLLNFYAIYSLAKWAEQSERTMNETVQPPAPSTDMDQYDEEELRTMKVPFLKNECFDNHFDLSTPNELVRKSLLWFSWNLSATLSDSGRKELASRIESMLSAEEPDKVPFILADNATPLSELAEEIFAPILPDAETALMNHQLNLFNEWNDRRIELIKAQAERLNMLFRLKEIKDRREELVDEKKVLFFFENRVEWEEKSREKDELFDKYQLNVKESELTEQEYADTLFDTARRIMQGSYVSPDARKSAVVDEDAIRKQERRRLLKAYGKYVPKTVHNLRRREVPPLIGKLRAGV